ncbi:MAG: flagellar basal body rod C-terminal domain-containing protein [Wolinella sp.]
MQVGSSSIHAHTQWISNSAHNVANVNTEGFRAHSTHLEERGEGGVNAQTRQNEERTDLVRETSDQMIAQKGVEANTQTIKTYDEMLGTVLNIKA